MTSERPNWYWRLMWMYVSPAVIIFLIIFYFIAGDTLQYGSYIYPKPFVTLSHFVALFPLIFVPAIFLYRYCKEGGWIVSITIAHDSYITFIYMGAPLLNFALWLRIPFLGIKNFMVIVIAIQELLFSI